MAKYNNVQKSYEELKREEREREEFFANLSHELKTPINIIYSSIQLMSLFKGKSDEVFKEYYLKHEKSVRINCLRMLKIIQNMIDINKIDCGAIKPKFGNYNLVSLVEEVTMSVLSSVEVKNIYITFDTDEEEMIAKCDPYMIERIILNLLSNAIKFSKENGFIHVRMKQKDGYILVIISDNGIGIPNNMKENIFNKFIQVDRTFKRKNEGSGIGLSLVKSLVDVHNGYIEVESMEDVGSEFKIYIPNITINEVEAIDKYDVDIDRVFSELSDIYEL
nr:HAMP domain-containing sensor histidine kinase [Clostridium celatum]